MNLLCDTFNSLWSTIYDTCYAGLDTKTRITVGLVLLFVSLIFFILCSKGKKSHIVNNWFWFWICMATFILSVLYLT